MELKKRNKIGLEEIVDALHNLGSKEENPAYRQYLPIANVYSIVPNESTGFGKNNYMCEICLELFCSFKDLRQHVRLHSVTEKYQCHKCGKFFAGYAHFRSHKCQHSFAYTCRNCNVKFVKALDLVSHLKNQHGVKFGRKIKCNLCSSTFRNKKLLNSHKKKAHIKGQYQIKVKFAKKESTTTETESPESPDMEDNIEDISDSEPQELPVAKTPKSSGSKKKKSPSAKSELKALKKKTPKAPKTPKPISEKKRATPKEWHCVDCGMYNVKRESICTSPIANLVF